MKIVKWICFILVCCDAIAYVFSKLCEANKDNTVCKKLGRSIGLILGIFARTFVLYGAATCWLLN